MMMMWLVEFWTDMDVNFIRPVGGGVQSRGPDSSLLYKVTLECNKFVTILSIQMNLFSLIVA